MIVVDVNVLILLMYPESTQNDNRRAERVRYLVDQLAVSREPIMIPAPALAELVAGRAAQVEVLVERLARLKQFIVQPFDSVIAIETGERIAEASLNIHASQRVPGWKSAMKYDAMIAATAIVRGARAVFTTDSDLRRYLANSSVSFVMVDDLPLPPEDPQQSLEL